MLVALLVLSVILALAQLVPPAPLSASATPTQFSAQRAMPHLEAIAHQSRYAGSPGHTAAREHLIDAIAALGLEPEVQSTTVVQRWPGATRFEVGTVQNVLVRLAGTASTGAIALDGHYDSGPTAPGAADCGGCVATLLETLRALRAGPPLQNDVIFVFADAEETGDLGAHAFVTQHPWNQDVRLAINFEATGNQGPSVLYSTNHNNQRLIAGFVSASPHPVAHSFASAFLHWLPMLRGGCDLEEFMDRGSAGLGFALAGNTTGYHTKLDNVQTFDRRSLQHQGSYALALVQYFGNQDLTTLQTSNTKSQSAVYFNVLPKVVVYYSTAWAMPLAAAVSLLYLGVVGLGLRRRQLSLKGLLVGAIVFGISAIAAVLLAALLWWGIKTANSNLQVTMVGHYRTLHYFVGLVCFTVALMAIAQLWLQKKLSLSNRIAGALLVWDGLMLLTSAQTPDISYLFTFPLLFSLLLLGWQLLDPRFRLGSWVHILALTLAALPGTLLLLPAMVTPNLAWMLRFEYASPLPFLALSLIFVVLLMGLLIPHVEVLTANPRQALRPSRSDWSRRWLLPGLLLLASGLIFSVATATSGFDADHPRPNLIAYELNVDSGEATWVSEDAQLDDWTAQFFPAQTPKTAYETFLGMRTQAFQAPAPIVPLAAPDVELLSDTVSGRDRRLHLRLTSPRQAVNLHGEIAAGGVITAATVNGQEMDLAPFPLEARDHLAFSYYNLPPDGIDLILTVQSAQPLQLTLRDTSYGPPQIPDQAIAPRPADKMPAAVSERDPTAVMKTFRL
ncbi:M20/M25/M40 family metallo-hydrolase [Halomicronema hongdechloris]|uniref:M20/M25/M40 family metallo-hydrolase n=1 Tax=Halomicronema hongdechloris TaxID=1209493 RepID=UPI0009D2531F|nr:M20/M25/M40 family metallo-hydrolase [Halomicronema hongdechloris]